MFPIYKISSITFLFCFGGFPQAQQLLWFGTVKIESKISQGRFEILKDSLIQKITYAPYGISPTQFKNVKHDKNKLTFSWVVKETTYNCQLLQQDTTAFTGTCTSRNGPFIQLTMREFTTEDAILQGNALPASQKDIQILDRALLLLNKGKNWSRLDNRVCDLHHFPNKWSLFCALHRASIDVDIEYKHLRPAIQAARQAINEATSGKEYAHLLQDFNNEAKSFGSIESVLARAKEIINTRIKNQE